MKPGVKHIAALVLVLFLGIAAEPAAGDELVEFEGLIEPYEMVNVGAPVEGVVEQINVQRSASVRKGDPLIVLESSVERAAVERARVMAASMGDIALEKERLAFALRRHARVGQPLSSTAMSAEEKDQAATEVTLARARLQKAGEAILLARLDLERAQALLAQRTIKSPISGIVVERFIAPGEYAHNQPLLKLAQIDPLRVEVILPAEMFGRIRPGMKADVKPESRVDSSFDSIVVIVDRVIDPATGTFGVRLELPNPDYRLPSGLKCTVRFPEAKETVSPTGTKNPLEADKLSGGAWQQGNVRIGSIKVFSDRDQEAARQEPLLAGVKR